MQRTMTISYQHRQGRGSGIRYHARDLPTSPKLVIANHLLKNLSGFSIGDKVLVEYSKGLIIIKATTL